MVYESSLVLQVLFTFPWYGCGVDSISSAALEGVRLFLGCPGETDKHKNGTRGCLGYPKW